MYQHPFIFCLPEKLLKQNQEDYIWKDNPVEIKYWFIR